MMSRNSNFSIVCYPHPNPSLATRANTCPRGTGTARAATSIACEARERGLSAEWQTAPNALFSCINSVICGRVPPGQKSYCLVQDFIAAFAFVMLAFQRLDACGAKRVMPTATLARFNPSHYHSHFRFCIYGMALAVCFQDA